MDNPKIKTDKFDIAGMDCADCALRIEKEVGRLPAVQKAEVNFMASRLQVSYREGAADGEAVRRAVEKAGYRLAEETAVQKSVLLVKGMDCADEKIPIEKRLKKEPGISDIRFNLLAQKLIVRHRIPQQAVIGILAGLGFEAVPEKDAEKAVRISFLQRQRQTVLTATSGVFLLAGGLLNFFWGWSAAAVFLLVAAILSGGYPFARKGWREARNLELGMNFLMTAAVAGAAAIGEWSEAAMVVFLFSLAQLLESSSMERARNSISSLMRLAPDTARMKSGGEFHAVPVEQVRAGQVIFVKPGDRIPLDGMVEAGFSTVNEAPITGESLPREKTAGAEVFAGSINQQGTLEVRVSRPAEDSTLARIIRLVEEAQARRAPTQQFVEKFARYYTPAVVALAVLLAAVPPLFTGAAFSVWFYRSLVLLVISCPCALVISTPVTIVSGLAGAARKGILIKGGVFLEGFNEIRALALDKTGTLTPGRPRVQSVVPLNSHSETDLLRIAAALESGSEHPVGQAIVEHAAALGIRPPAAEDFSAVAGKGVQGTIAGRSYLLGNHRLFEENGRCRAEIHPRLECFEKQRYTAVLLGDERGVIGLIALADALRENGRSHMEALKKAGVAHTVMLTGDNALTAAAIAAEAGIEEFRAELLPQDKLTVVQELKSRYGKIAMAGDGINDAPALAAADIGIAMGAAGTDTALETADIALMNDDLGMLAHLKRLSRKVAGIIRQNIFIALFLKIAFILLAIPGLATLWMAVFADMGASLIVIFNGMRALKVKNA